MARLSRRRTCMLKLCGCWRITALLAPLSLMLVQVSSSLQFCILECALCNPCIHQLPHPASIHHISILWSIQMVRFTIDIMFTAFCNVGTSKALLRHIEVSVLCSNPLISWHSVFGLCNTALMCVAQQSRDPPVCLGILRVSSTRYRYCNKAAGHHLSLENCPFGAALWVADGAQAFV